MLHSEAGGDAMNPILPGVPPPIPISVSGALEILVLLAIASMVVLFVMALREIRASYRRRERLICPVRLRRARVVFRLWPDGHRADVIRCSEFGSRRVTCGKAC